MNSKTKIIVLHLKELIYTGIFVALGILFVILLLIMFLPKNKDTERPAESDTVPPVESTVPESESAVSTRSYIPGVYTSSLTLSGHCVDVEVIVNRNAVTSMRLVNLNESVTTMYPLIEPVFSSVSEQILSGQSPDLITYAHENKYTTLVISDAVKNCLAKATESTLP